MNPKAHAKISAHSATILAVLLLLCAAIAVLPISDKSDATYTGYGTIYEIDLAPGFSYSYTPTYPSDLTVTTSIEKYESTGINASLSNKTLSVTVKDGITSGSYDIILKATSSTGGIDQVSYQHIRINVVSGLSVSGSIDNIVLGDSISFTPSGSSGMGDVAWSVKTGTSLPAGLTFVNGTLSGTPTTLGTNTVYLTASAAGETQDLTLTFTVYSALTPTNTPSNGVIVYVLG